MGFFGDLKDDLSQTAGDSASEEAAGQLELDVDALLAEAERAADEVQGADGALFGEAIPDVTEVPDVPIIPEFGEGQAQAPDLDALLAEALGGSGTEPAAAATEGSSFGTPTDLAEETGEGGSGEFLPDPELPIEEPIPEPLAEPSEEPRAEDVAVDAVFADLEAFSAANAEPEPEREDVVEETVGFGDYQSKGANEMDEKDFSEETSVITGGMCVSGDVNTEGSLELIGAVNGNVEVKGKLNVTGHIVGNSTANEIFAENAKITGDVKSESSVKIGAGTVIIGNIAAFSAAIAGAVKGDIDVHGPVILDSTAIVMGNIRSKSVQINNGAAIEGNCSQCYADVSPTSFFDDYKPEKKAGKSGKKGDKAEGES